MSDEKRGSSDERTASWLLDDLGAKSVLVKLAPEGRLGGAGLRQLEDEGRVVEIRTGPDRYQVLKALG
jgi:hypothetical protein